MILYIDSSVPDESVIRLDDTEVNFKATIERKQQILIEINKLFIDTGCQFKDLSSIEVVTGPGSYTGVRISVAIANAMALSLDIPVVAIISGQKEASSKTVLPYYDRPAKITQPK